MALYGLFLAAAGETTSSGQAMLSPASDPDHVNGGKAKIIDVDPCQRTLILQIKDKEYLFYVDPHVVDTKSHRQILMNELVPGRFVRFMARPQAKDHLDIVSLTMDPADATGSSGAGGIKGGPVVSPFR